MARLESATKMRPALVLARAERSRRNRLATVAMITSQIEALKLDGDVLTIGSLSSRERESTRQAFRRVFSAWSP